MVLLVARSAAIFMFGTKLFKSSRFVTSCCWMTAALSAVTAIGTLCKSSENRRVVTTTSCKLPAEEFASSAAAALPAATKEYQVKAISKLRIMAGPPTYI